MPLLGETGYMPTYKYASGDEIREHAQRIGTKFGFYDKTYFQTETKSMRWSDETSTWSVKTDLGDTITSRFVIVAAGTLHRPKFPDLPGLGTFKGHTFHTSRWDYAYTGGDQSGNLTNLADKRVGIIGTGATSVQAVPHLGAAAKQLYVFQRTPSSIGVRGNTPTDAQWAKTLGDKWQRRRVDNFTTILDGRDQPDDLVADGWTAIMRHPEDGMNPSRPAVADKPVATGGQPDMAAIVQQMQIADFKQMEKVRRRCNEVVEDKDTAEKLKPYYNLLCKR
jgi:cyclohexanone monooxygenase